MVPGAPSEREGLRQALVGREELLTRFRSELECPEPLIIDLAGPEGIGKSALLERLASEARERGALTMLVSLDAYSPRPAEEERDLDFKDIRLSEHFRLLRELARQLPFEAHRRFAERLEAVVSVTATREPSHLTLESAAEDAVVALTEGLRTAEGRVVVLADDFTAVREDHLGRWFVMLLRELADAGVLAVVARMSAADPPRYPEPVLTVHLRPLSQSDVDRWLQEALGRPVEQEVVEAVARWSGGYPIALKAAVMTAREADGLDDLRRRLDEPPRPLTEAMEPVLRRLRGADKPLGSIVEIGGVVREFDEELILTLLADLRVDPPTDLNLVLEALPFVRVDRERYRFPDFFRRAVQRDLERRRDSYEQRSRLDTIHKHALDYYREKGGLAIRGSTGYAAGQRFDRPDTRSYLLEEVHHAVALRDGPSARQAFATAYLDAFWWWVRSEFCARLLEEWKAREGEPEDQHLHRLLCRLQADYRSPTDLEDDVPECGRRAYEALTALCRLLGITGSGDPTPKEAHLLAILDVLTANELRIAEPDSDGIAALYDEAHGLLLRNEKEAAWPRRGRGVEDDGWCIPWVLTYQADHARERGSHSEARAKVQEAFTRARASSDLDWEVLAFGHQMLGQVAFAEGRWSRAFVHYGRAVACAYVFQGTEPLDTYTVDVYVEATDLLLARAYELARRDRHAAAGACAVVNALFEPYWREVGERPAPPTFDWPRLDDAYGRGRLAAMLFPPPRPAADPRLERAYVERIAALEPVLRRAELGPEGDRAAGHQLRLRSALSHALRAVSERLRKRAAPAPPIPADSFFQDNDEVWPGHWVDDGPKPWARLDQDDELDVFLRESVDRLPPRQREVVTLRDIEGISAEDVSEWLDLSPSDQLVTLHRARAELRARLNERRHRLERVG